MLTLTSFSSENERTKVYYHRKYANPKELVGSFRETQGKITKLEIRYVLVHKPYEYVLGTYIIATSMSFTNRLHFILDKSKKSKKKQAREGGIRKTYSLCSQKDYSSTRAT